MLISRLDDRPVPVELLVLELLLLQLPDDLGRHEPVVRHHAHEDHEHGSQHYHGDHYLLQGSEEVKKRKRIGAKNLENKN